MALSSDGRWTGAIHFVVADQPLSDGVGHTITDDRGLFVLHAALLHTGKVLCFCGHVESGFYPPLSYVFDPKDPGALLTPIPFPAGTDLFCCHYVQLPIGRILVVGGSDTDFRHHGSVGAKNICIFDPVLNTWGNTHKKLLQGRWYPTPVHLPDGRVMVVSGRPEHLGGDISDKVEILSPPNRESKELAGASAVKFPIYPGLHLAPNGKVYWTGTTWGQEIANPDTASITVPSDVTVSTPWTVYGGKHPAQNRREEGMSVLLPLTQTPATDGQILVIGGSNALKSAANGGIPVLQGGAPTGLNGFDHIAMATDPFTAEILDTTKDPPVWSSAPSLRPAGNPPMFRGRTNGHCVLLPDETVLICGGHNGYKWQAQPTTQPSLEAEIFTPGSGFRLTSSTPAVPGDRMGVPRMYHSVALLLPDGRVMVAGGADPNRAEPVLPWPVDWGGTGIDNELTYDARAPAPGTKLGYSGMPLNDKTFEFYEPPYYFKPDRASQPVITDVMRGGSSTRRVKYGQSFVVNTPQAASIERVAIMRPGAPTHHTDTEQRYVRLDFTAGGGKLTVNAVTDPKLAPPGFYMLWIVDTSKRPCKDAVFIHLV